MHALAEKIKASGGRAHVFIEDLSVQGSAEALYNQIKSQNLSVDILINNAGNAHGLDTVDTANLDDWDAMIDGNVKGVMYVTKAILTQMVERKAGQIINLGSIAGIEVYPKGNVYCASKFAIDAFTQGLRIDLNPYKIRV